MKYSDLSEKEREKYEKMAKETLFQVIYNILRHTDSGKCLLCRHSLGKQVLTFKNDKWKWDGAYFHHIKETHGMEPNHFVSILNGIINSAIKNYKFL